MTKFELTYKGVKVTLYAEVVATVYIETPQGHFFGTDPLPLELAHDRMTPIVRLADLSELDAIIDEADEKGLFVAEEMRKAEEAHRRAKEQ